MRHFAAEKDVISGTFAQVTLRRRRNQAAFSWTEVVLLLFLMMIVLILLLSRVCGPSSNPARGQMIQTLGNMKQLH